MLARAETGDTGGESHGGNNPVPAGVDPSDYGNFEGRAYSLKNRDYLIGQLQKINTLTNNTTFTTMPVSAAWLYADLATRMASFDIRDIRELQMGLFKNGVHLAVSEPGSVPQYYNTRTERILEGVAGDPGSKLFSSTVGGGGTISYYTMYTDSGIPVFAVVKGDSGFWEDVKKSAGIIGLILAFTGVGAAIGAAVMGTAAAAAYPLVASAIGNIAIGTVLSGGDIQSAVQNGLLGMAAQGIGGYIGGITDSATIGAAAQAATNAALKKQDIFTAVAMSAATSYGQQGIKMLNDAVDNSVDPGLSDFSDPGFFPDLSFLDVDFTSVLNQLDLSATSLIPDDWGNIFNVTGDFVQLDPKTWSQWLYPDSVGNIRDASNNIVLTAEDAENAIANNPDMSPDMAVKMELWSLAVNSPSGVVVAAPPTENTPKESPAPASQVKTPATGGMTWAEFANNAFKLTMQYETARLQLMRTGRVVPTYATGSGVPYSQVTGLPVVRSDGSIVVRNANGTQTITYPDGTSETVGGIAQATGISTNVLIAGGALLAAVLIAR